MNPVAAGLFVDSSTISKNLKSTKQLTVDPETELQIKPKKGLCNE